MSPRCPAIRSPHRPGRRLGLAAALLVLGAHSAAAQVEVDWQRYYPLAVGNVWEYEDAETPVFTRFEIVSDTLAGGHRYFRRQVDHGVLTSDGPVLWTEQDVVRYDSAGYVVRASPLADTVRVDPCSGDEFSRPLRAPHGARIACPGISTPYGPDSLFAYVGVQEYDPEQPGSLLLPVPPDSVAPFRAYSVDHLLTTYFEIDVGPISAGNLWGPRLRYARIGGVERGSSWFATPSESAPVPGTDLTVALLGNPTRGRLAFRAEAAVRRPVRYRVIDALGRVVATGDVATGRDVLLAAPLAPGVYVVRVEGEGEAATARATVLR